MATFLGPARDRALTTRRSPYRVGQLVCTVCTAHRRTNGGLGFVRVRRCRVLVAGVLRPGVQCPQCLTTWIEHEDQPDRVQ